MHKHIDQLQYQPDFESTQPSKNENETVNPEILVDKDIQLPQLVDNYPTTQPLQLQMEHLLQRNYLLNQTFH